MFARVSKIGDWKTIQTIVKNINSVAHAAMTLSLQRWALKAEGQAKFLISTQSFHGFPPLAPYTVERKARLGYPADMMFLETGTYFQNITSTVDIATYTSYAGVKRGVRQPNSNEDEAEIAMLLEYGFLEAGLPPRPLWGTVYIDTMLWHQKHNRPEQIFMELLNKKFR